MTIKDSSGQIQIGAHAAPANNLVLDNSANTGVTTIYTGNAGFGGVLRARRVR